MNPYEPDLTKYFEDLPEFLDDCDIHLVGPDYCNHQCPNRVECTEYFLDLSLTVMKNRHEKAQEAQQKGI